jgi:hypothetical protein
VARVKYQGTSPKNEDLLSSSDVFSRTTETIPDLVDFSAGSEGDSFESSFQTFGCLVSRYGRLFVKSLRREEQGRNVALLMSEQTGTATVLIEVKTRMKNHFEFSFFHWMGASPQTPGIF